MANVTFKVIQNETTREAGTRLLMLRVTYDRKHKYIGTGVSVPEKAFNPDSTYEKRNWVRKSYPDAETLNATIHALQKKGLSVVLALQELNQAFTVGDIKARIENDLGDSFSGHIEREIETYRLKGKRSCAGASRTVLANLRLFFKLGKTDKQGKGEPIPYSLLTRERMQEFETFLVTKKRTRATTPGKCRNTASGYLGRLRQHIRQYIVAHSLPDAADPFRGRIFEHTQTEVVRLTEAEIDRWYATPIPNPEGRAGLARQEHARLLYFCCYGIQGIRAGDLISARVSQFQQVWEIVNKKAVQRWRFLYVSDKRDLAKSILIDEPVLSIILGYCQGKAPDEFVFPFLKDKHRYMSEQELEEPLRAQVGDVDRQLKKVCEKLGIKQNVTLHTARHSYAEHLYDLTGDIKAVQNSLGHADMSHSAKYVSRMKQTRVDKGNSVYDRWKQQATDEQPNDTETVLKQSAQ